MSAVVSWAQLRPGDEIRCPVTGSPERVTDSHHHRTRGGRWLVRTSRHYHLRPAGETVQVIRFHAEH